MDEEWIPVVDRGRSRDVSLRYALTRAHEVDGLALGHPLETVAVLRQVLLPVYLHACGSPVDDREWGRRWKAGRLDPDGVLDRYLDGRRDGFDLFGGRPFAQVAGLRTGKDETKPVSLLLAAAATGNNVPLFASRTEADPPTLTCAQAARAVLAAQCWDTAAIKSGAADDPRVKGGKTTGNPTGPVGGLGVVVPTGRNLFETILLNTLILPQPQDGDRPQWAAGEADSSVNDPWPGGPRWARRPVKGILDLLTWQSRRIRLIPEAVDGVTVVRRVVLTAGDRIDRLPEYEPHTAWRRVDKPKAGEPPNRPIRHVSGRAAWRGMEPLLATRLDMGAPVTSSELLRQLNVLRARRVVARNMPVQVVTVRVEYGNQSAVIEDVIADRIALPVAALDPEGPARKLLMDVVAEAEALRNAGNRLGDDLRQASGADKLPWDKGHRIGDALIIQFTPLVSRILQDLQRDPDDVDRVHLRWRTDALRLAFDAAEPALASVPPTAFRGRARKDKASDGARRDGGPVNASAAEAWFRGSVRKILNLDREPTMTGAA
ncbi:type I-E CRISPR-associated protein Cse1/CasA [Micromonospora sp. LOL_023]|uniref:type I-E CRISPR-associated protein Cse1/CasA n=1 Tax=Micromonospora sp. LOL_023 TaxID=3345418 RepID=UPI003A892426